MSKTIEIGGIVVHLCEPSTVVQKFVGQNEIVKQLKAAWLIIDDKDSPMNPRLIGKPGVGKTTLACHVGMEMKRDLYIQQATMDTRPEDLIITPVISEDQKIKYVASPLVSAMLTGSLLILDEGNRMSEKAWASLAPLLDHRRYVESIVAGIKIQAHKDFLFCTTMNEDSSTYEIPEYIFSRIQPGIYVDYPQKEEERAILVENLPSAPSELIEYVVDFLQVSHQIGESYSIRDGINVARYAFKLMKINDIDCAEGFQKSLELIINEGKQKEEL